MISTIDMAKEYVQVVKILTQGGIIIDAVPVANSIFQFCYEQRPETQAIGFEIPSQEYEDGE